MTRAVQVLAPSRLHFGMFSFGHDSLPQFGGMGVMIDRPGIDLRLFAAEQFTARGPLSERAEAIARNVFETLRPLCPQLPPACRIQIAAAPPEHAGLGTGTQLSLAIAAGIRALGGMPAAEPAELAALSGRGQRSAIGTYGFVSGGFLVEAGKLSEQKFSPLVARVELPAEWRFVLLFSPREENSAAGLSGESERTAFASLPPVPPEVTAALCQETLLNVLPAARQREFARFSAGLYRFGYLAGNCFATCQGGPFASPALARLVEKIRSLGVAGVGQSSWGPTLFALLENEVAATKLVQQLQQDPAAAEVRFQIAAPAARGARIQEFAESPAAH